MEPVSCRSSPWILVTSTKIWKQTIVIPLTNILSTITCASVGHPVVSDIVTILKVSSVIPFLKRSRGEFLARKAIRDSIALMKSSGPVLAAELDGQLMTVSIACVVLSRASKLVKRPVSFSTRQGFWQGLHSQTFFFS